MASEEERPWREFVLCHGWRVPVHHLAAVLGQSEQDISKVRHKATRGREPLRFPELFAMWRGRAPADSDWPVPKRRADGNYEWLPNEEALLASLIGQLGVAEIATVLSARLQSITQDPSAARTQPSCQLRTNRIGLQSSDLVGGLSVAAAAREIGSRQVVEQAIREGRIRTRRVGRLVLIPYDQWHVWKATRRPPPAGKVRLSTLREPLGIRSDAKLPEFAKLGYIPTAEMHRTYDGLTRGDWYVCQQVAEKLVRDRRLGLPMPWHGRPLQLNLEQTYRLWQQRQHPLGCPTCQHIWGQAGAPVSFVDYCVRYPMLDHGAKRHLTRQWEPGLTIAEAAAKAQRTEALVCAAIECGVLPATSIDGALHITSSDLARWIARGCPSGDGRGSWLALESAERAYGFTRAELQAYLTDGTLRHKVGDAGDQRGVIYVLRQQCSDLRSTMGFSVDEAAARCGVTIERMRQLLMGVQWRGGDRVPLWTLQAVKKRIKSRAGFSVEQSAKRVGRSEQWVRDRVADGTIRVHAAKWSPERLYISAPMLKRLEAAAASGVDTVEKLGGEWLNLNAAAMLAGVALGTLRKWHDAGELESRAGPKGPVFHEDVVKDCAGRYWATVRFQRAQPPAWYRDGLATA